MPIYEYECTSCGDKLDVFQKIGDKPLQICTQCGGHLKKLISNTSFVLKGGGWYITDYPSKDRKEAMGNEKSGIETPKANSQPKQTSTDKKTEPANESSATKTANTNAA
ncbi:MAG: zinc ribbon domain-containing protein [Candidatus Magnetoovum sp. WYHC-5]|nr:zinc ribbon domain-containing protein [Candidatus Magnetoovum sp. WYHC-5]